MLKIEEGLVQTGLMIGAGELWFQAKPEVIWQLTEDLSDFPRIEESDGFVKIVTPIPDDERHPLDREVLERLWSIARFVADKRVLTVCAAGQNRSGLASALILIARHGISGDEAIVRVQGYSGRAYSFHDTVVLWNRDFQRQLRDRFPRKDASSAA